MYDEVMQLITLAKNDERYFQRIEELKAKQLELAQVTEIAKTLGEADKHLAMARQNAEAIINKAKEEAEDLKLKVTDLEVQLKAQLTKLEKREQIVSEQEGKLVESQNALEKLRKDVQEEKDKAHQHYLAADDTATRARKLQKNIESKFARIRAIMNEGDN